MQGCGASTQKRCPYGHADGFFRHHTAAARVPSAASPKHASQPAHGQRYRPGEPDPVLARVHLDEDDRGRFSATSPSADSISVQPFPR